MEKINKLCFIIVFGIICFIVGFYTSNKNNKIDDNKITITDTIYNKVILDSIKYNIKIKDSIIVQLKNKIQYEVEQAINANDSVAIKQFKTLAGAN